MLRNKIVWLAFVLSLLIPTAVVLAATSVTVGSYRVDLVEFEVYEDETATYIYAVTGIAPAKALSHWTLGMYTCSDFIVEPADSSYTTSVDIEGCQNGTYTCEAATYTVEAGHDATLNIDGIKFQDSVPQLTNGKTHIFEITVSNFAFDDPVSVGAKYGGNEPVAEIDGPFCGSTTAVSFRSSNAIGTSSNQFVPLLLLSVFMLIVLSILLLRRRSA